MEVRESAQSDPEAAFGPDRSTLHTSYLVERSSQVRNCSPGYMEHAPSSNAASRGHEASLQSGLDVGCKLYSSSKKLRGLNLRAQARCIISTSLLFSVVG